MNTVLQLPPAQLAAQAAGVQVVDVREPDEVATGRIAGSTSIPLGQLPAHLNELDRATPVVTVCQSGRRGQRAAEVLAAAGFTVADLGGGMNAWLSDGQTIA
jgi:rhodanese-related sulfurtransferase